MSILHLLSTATHSNNSNTCTTRAPPASSPAPPRRPSSRQTHVCICVYADTHIYMCMYVCMYVGR